MSNKKWIDLLDDEDLAFLKRFVLASGSLKEMAKAYSISYPTVRLRLDRLIAKIEVFDSQSRMSDFERTLRGLLIDGKIDLSTLKTLLAAHAKENEKGTNHVSTDDVSRGASADLP
ncbi:DUF2089 family protein [Schlesneria sp. T3-172]|uniref:DUF2089 family protein n=1 Tax=Schlesneria TaxID=656899 RepID=UPI002F09DEE5